MSAARPYLPRGITNQGRLTHTAMLDREDASGLCDTVPGELDYPEAVYQAEPDELTYWRVIGLTAGVALGSVAMTALLIALSNAVP